jgi:tRNA-2-methylthio-N6-dimethylallyladenosine synthase
MSAELRGARFFIRTFGCQMNENDSEHIAGLLVQAGAVRSESPEESDIVIVNTCAVREKSEEKLFSFLGRIAAMRKGGAKMIGVVGCVAQIYREELFRRKAPITFVAGPDNYRDIPLLLTRDIESRQVRTGRSRTWHEFGPEETLRDSGTSAFVPIMEGCDNFCAYCVVPFSRGRVKCRPRDKVLDEVRYLARAGYREIQLLGQNVNSYRDPESGTDFADLLDEVARDGGIEWIRFLTSHPRDLTPAVARVMVGNRNICRQIHLPLQSGSTAVLRRMNRGYTRDEYMARIDLLKETMPDISLSTDIIVGFPGETDGDFEETLRAIEDIGYANIFSFRYSPRPRTAAARMRDDVPPGVKRRRLIALQEEQKRIQLAANSLFVGREIKVLCVGEGRKGEGVLAGRNEGFQVVNFRSASDVRGRFVDVRITGCGAYSLHGEVRGDPPAP